MLKGLVKLGVSSSAVSGVILIDLQPKDIPAKGNEVLLEKIKSNTEKFASIHDVALYEKTNGCTFAFSYSEGLEKLYTGEEFLRQVKTEHPKTELSEKSIFEWADSGKTYCNSGVVTLFRNGNVLRLGDPTGGWGS